MFRMMKMSLIFVAFVSGLSTLTLTGCSSASSSAADAVPLIDGMTPGEYHDKLQKEAMKHVGKSGRKAKRRH